ncbi:MAG: acetyl-CoA carboxylase carboxyltransferase subunit alpha [Christensenellaceae bacterium]
MSEKLTAWEVVGIARNPKRPTSKYLIEHIFTDFLEMHGDKLYADDAAIIGGIGMLDGRAVTVIGQEKGTDIADKSKRNFGCAHPEGYRKSLRLMKQAEKFNRPVICIVDTQGAFCGIGAEERGMGEAIARNLLELSRLKVPVISVLIGEGGSGGALALAVSDRLAMLENSVYSILSPEGFSSILWKDSSRAPEAADLMRMTAKQVHKMGLIDDVIAEPQGGAQSSDDGEFAKVVKNYMIENLKQLCKKPIEQLLESRYNKIRNFGANFIEE